MGLYLSLIKADITSYGGYLDFTVSEVGYYHCTGE